VVGFLNKRVYNKAFGKIVRTLGFILILVSSLLYLTKIVMSNPDLPLRNYLLMVATPVNDFLAANPNINAILSEYAMFGLVFGYLFLVFAIRKGFIVKLILTLSFLVLLVNAVFAGSTYLLPQALALEFPLWLTNVLNPLEALYLSLVSVSEYIIPGVAAAVPFFLWVVYAYKKPGRLSLLLLRAGSILLFLAVLAVAVEQLFVPSLADLAIVGTITLIFYVLNYTFAVLGSVLGVLGFFRK
jgi:uncharacterized membrane protein